MIDFSTPKHSFVATQVSLRQGCMLLLPSLVVPTTAASLILYLYLRTSNDSRTVAGDVTLVPAATYASPHRRLVDPVYVSHDPLVRPGSKKHQTVSPDVASRLSLLSLSSALSASGQCRVSMTGALAERHVGQEKRALAT